jgi:signal peptidase I
MDKKPAFFNLPTGLPDPDAINEQNRRKDNFRSIITTVVILIAAPLVAWFITSFVFQSYEVFGPSMQSTLQNGDRLIVLKAPRTWSKIFGRTYMPKRGEIVIFSRDELFSGASESSRQLIKRVIALPGERVKIIDGKVIVYNDQFPEGFEPDAQADYGQNIGYTTGEVNDVLVKEGEVFVCGDNRDNSLDSRSFGPVKTEDIVGTATYRFLPLGEMRNL